MSAARPGGVGTLQPMSSAEAHTYQRLRGHLDDIKLTAPTTASVTAAPHT